MGQEHVIEPRLDVTGKNTQMTEVVAEINKIKTKKRKLIETMQKNELEITNTNLGLEYLYKKIYSMEQQRERFNNELVESVNG